MPFKPNHFPWLFAVLVFSDIVVGTLGLTGYRFVTKPLILFSLLIYFGFNGRGLSKFSYFLMAIALFLSLLGDIFLILETSGSLFFIPGLIAFLMAHLCYCSIFLKQWGKRPTSGFWWFALFLGLYGTTLFLSLKPYTGALTIPVIIYILAILGMALAAFGRKKNGNTLSFNLVLSGALLFIASDTFLAINKFVFPIPFSNLLIMVTYAAAQFLIVRGMLEHKYG